MVIGEFTLLGDFEMEWYVDNDLEIIFSQPPLVGIRYVIPSMDKAEKQSIKKYPFINRRDLTVMIRDKKKEVTHAFTIPKGFCFDGASIPRMFWRIIGSNTDNSFLVAALIHDVLCTNHQYVNNDRYLADKVFERLLYVAGVPAFKRWLMFHSVDNYQKFCGWKKNNE